MSNPSNSPSSKEIEISAIFDCKITNKVTISLSYKEPFSIEQILSPLEPLEECTIYEKKFMLKNGNTEPPQEFETPQKISEFFNKSLHINNHTKNSDFILSYNNCTKDFYKEENKKIIIDPCKINTDPKTICIETSFNTISNTENNIHKIKLSLKFVFRKSSNTIIIDESSSQESVSNELFNNKNNANLISDKDKRNGPVNQNTERQEPETTNPKDTVSNSKPNINQDPASSNSLNPNKVICKDNNIKNISTHTNTAPGANIINNENNSNCIRTQNPKSQHNIEINESATLTHENSLSINNNETQLATQTKESNLNINNSTFTDNNITSKVNNKRDPRKLWNNIPTSPDIRFKKPDEDKFSIDLIEDHLKIFGASKRGRSHAHIGSPRDDDFAIIRTDNENWNVMIVADGAGSAKYSREGSRIACDYIKNGLNRELSNSESPLNTCISQIIKKPTEIDTAKLKKIKLLAYSQLVPTIQSSIPKIEETVKSCNEVQAELKDFATTLLLLISKKIGNKYLFLSFSIGDGAIVIFDQKEIISNDTPIVKDGKSQYLYKSLLMNNPDSGEFAGQTRFLTMKSIFKNGNELINRISIHIVESFTAAMIMTDGVSDAKFETEQQLTIKENWDQFWNDLTRTGSDDSQPLNLDSNAEELSTQLLSWLDYWVIGNHDDRTIVVMYKYE